MKALFVRNHRVGAILNIGHDKALSYLYLHFLSENRQLWKERNPYHPFMNWNLEHLALEPPSPCLGALLSLPFNGSGGTYPLIAIDLYHGLFPHFGE